MSAGRGLAAATTILAGLFLVAPSVHADALPDLTSIAFEEAASPAPPSSGEPNLCVSGSDVYLSWIHRPETGPPAFQFATWTGDGWSHVTTIAADKDMFVNWADFPGLLALGDGMLAASWLRKSGPDTYAYDVWISTSTDGGATWAEPLRPHRDGTQTEHGFVSLVADPVEGFWAVWLDGRDYADESSKKKSPEMQVRTALWRNGSFGPEVVLDRRACDCCQTAAVRTLEGLAVAYRDRSPEQIRDISVVRYERRQWDKPFTLRNDGWKIDGCPVSGPALSSRDNLLAAAWFTNAADSGRVFVALSDSSAFGLSRIVQVDDGNPLGRVDVEWLPDESVLVTWVEEVGETAEVRARRVTLGGEAEDAFLLTPTDPGRPSGFPRLAVQDVNIWLAWTDVGADPARVRVGRLDMSKATR